jgi:bifunctional DNA-binding transcriptional regulator/antitoxin component of YhaV-PrlF toxin-antitoxin module
MNTKTKLGEQGYYTSKGDYKVNTYRLLINKQIINQLGWNKGSNLEIVVEGNKLIVKEIKD